jgi:hypothetical protein
VWKEKARLWDYYSKSIESEKPLEASGGFGCGAARRGSGGLGEGRSAAGQKQGRHGIGTAATLSAAKMGIQLMARFHQH